MTSALQRILMSRLLTRAGDNAWEFALPLMLARIYPHTLRPTAVFYVVSRLSVVLLMPVFGRWLDRTDRLTSARIGIALQCIGCFAIVILLLFGSRLNGTDGAGVAAPAGFSLIGIFLASGVAGALGANIMDVTLRGDWLPTLASGVERVAANSRLRQIDLFTMIISPVVTGFLLAWDAESGLFAKGFLAIITLNLLSYIPEYLLLSSVYRSEPAIRMRAPSHAVATRGLISEFRAGWQTFWKRPEVSVYLANACLWFTALVPHGMLLTAALSITYGFPETSLGWFRAIGAFAGILPTFVYNRLAARWGALRIAVAAISVELVFVVAAALFLSGNSQLILALACIAMSRLGLYAFTLAEIQIRQDTVPESERGAVGGVVASLNYSMIVGIYVVAVFLPRPQDFIYLAWLTAASIGTGAVLMWRYFIRSRSCHAAIPHA